VPEKAEKTVFLRILRDKIGNKTGKVSFSLFRERILAADSRGQRRESEADIRRFRGFNHEGHEVREGKAKIIFKAKDK